MRGLPGCVSSQRSNCRFRAVRNFFSSLDRPAFDSGLQLPWLCSFLPGTGSYPGQQRFFLYFLGVFFIVLSGNELSQCTDQPDETNPVFPVRAMQRSRRREISLAPFRSDLCSKRFSLCHSVTTVVMGLPFRDVSPAAPANMKKWAYGDRKKK